MDDEHQGKDDTTTPHRRRRVRHRELPHHASIRKIEPDTMEAVHSNLADDSDASTKILSSVSTANTKIPQVISEPVGEPNSDPPASSEDEPKKYELRSAEHIDWSDEHVLNTLTVEKIRRELKRRNQPFTGSRRVLIDRLLRHEQQQLQAQEEESQDESEEDVTSPAGGETQMVVNHHSNSQAISTVAAMEKDEEERELVDENVSLWSNDQIKQALRNMGYSTIGKRSTLLKRYRSVMLHIKKLRQQQDHSLVQSKTAKEPEVLVFIDDDEADERKGRSQKRYRDETTENNRAAQQKRRRVKQELSQAQIRQMEQDISEYEESVFLVNDQFVTQSSNLIDEEVLDILPTLSEATLSILNQYNNSDDIIESNQLVTKISDSSECLTAIHVGRKQFNLLHSLAGVEVFKQLKRLVCVGHRITDLSPLGSCVNLEEIFLSRNFITVIPSLKNLKQLSAISLSFNHIHDISGLSECDSLEYVNLSFNRYISNIQPLSGCSKLVELDLSGNALDCASVSQFDLFSCSNSLSSLRLSFNQIKSIRPIGLKFQFLNELSLCHNKIFDVSSLIHLRRLNELDLASNEDVAYSIEVYMNGYSRQQVLQQEKLKGVSKRRSKNKHFIMSSTEIAAEGNRESLLTGSIYDLIDGESDQWEHDGYHLWLHYGKVNFEVLECLAHLGTRCVVRKL